MVLHIANDFNFTKVHKELYSNLDSLGVSQTVFIPLKQLSQIRSNHFNFINKESQFVYSTKLKGYHRIFFRNKINVLFSSLIEEIDVKKVSVTHATTLFSDGAVAYKLYKKYNIPYVIAIRNTDINTFFKYRKDLIYLAYKILLNASKIIFISESNRQQFNKLPISSKIKSKIEDKTEVINNGIDQFWIENRELYERKLKDEYKLLFIGRFDQNKNIENLISAIDLLRKTKGYNLTLEVVGGTGINHNKVLKVIENTEWIKYHGVVNDKIKMKSIFSGVDFFCMISFFETFGLVYLEALSQGKPILFTEGQGIDNTFAFKVGEKVLARSIEDISSKIEILISSDYYDISNINFNSFIWKNIAITYKNLYNHA